MGRDWSQGKLTEGCNALKEAAVFFFNPDREGFPSLNEIDLTASNNSGSGRTPAIYTENSSSSNKSNIFFGPSQAINNQILENDNLEDKLDNEIKLFKSIISNNNYEILKAMNGESKDINSFFRQYGKTCHIWKNYLIFC